MNLIEWNRSGDQFKLNASAGMPQLKKSIKNIAPIAFNACVNFKSN